MRLFITGGSGLVGRRLAVAAVEAGHEVLVLSRSAARAAARLPAAVRVVEGESMQAGAWQQQAAACDAIVNLAGEGLFARRWNAAFKSALLRSRVETTRRVVEAMATEGSRARVLVSASAVGYYGHSEGVTFRESSPNGTGFLAELCAVWEGEANAAAACGARVVIPRIGVVLDAADGALAQMLPLYRMFVGGPLGSGRQYMSWIHIADLVGLILHALDTPGLSGPVNATAPHPVCNREFSRTLGRILGRPSFLKTPGFAIKWALGEVADAFLAGQRVLPEKAEASGYRFRFACLEDALRDLLPPRR
jgi:uncharacterized protein